MQPVSPITPSADADETTYAKDQSEYLSLPCIRTPDGTILTRWMLSEDEKRQIVEQGYIYLAVKTFNQKLQPIMPCAFIPYGFETRPLEEWPDEIG